MHTAPSIRPLGRVVQFTAGSSELPLLAPPRVSDERILRRLPRQLSLPGTGERPREGWIAFQAREDRYAIEPRLRRVAGSDGRLEEPAGNFPGNYLEVAIIVRHNGSGSSLGCGKFLRSVFSFHFTRLMWRLTPFGSAARPSRRETDSTNLSISKHCTPLRTCVTAATDR
jgi:hypothetical protein